MYFCYCSWSLLFSFLLSYCYVFFAVIMIMLILTLYCCCYCCCYCCRCCCNPVVFLVVIPVSAPFVCTIAAPIGVKKYFCYCSWSLLFSFLLSYWYFLLVIPVNANTYPILLLLMLLLLTVCVAWTSWECMSPDHICKGQRPNWKAVCLLCVYVHTHMNNSNSPRTKPHILKYDIYENGSCCEYLHKYDDRCSEQSVVFLSTWSCPCWHSVWIYICHLFPLV